MIEELFNPDDGECFKTAKKRFEDRLKMNKIFY